MKITFLIDSFSSGGKERQLYYLLDNLSTKNNIQLIILSDDIFYKEVFNIPIQIKIIPKHKRYNLSTQINIFKFLNQFSPDIIHVWDKISPLLIVPYQLTHKVKTINGSIRFAGEIKYNFKTNLLRKISYRMADSIVANSQQGLAVEGLEKNKKSKVIYNGINVDLECNFLKNNQITAITNKFNLNIVMVGRFYSAKDYGSYIEVAKRSIAKNDNIAFHCIGDGPLHTQAEKEAGVLANKNIFFWGNRTDVRDILTCFDIGVLLNNTNGHAEGLSNAIMEYMTARLPVIATNAGGTKELVFDRKNGFLVNAFDTKSISEKLQKLIHNKTLRIEFGQNGYEIIRKNFSIEEMKNNYEKLYNELIET